MLRPWLLAAVLSLPPLAAQDASVDAEFTMDKVTVDGRDYAFRRLVPLPAHRAGAQPLVVFLHGAGERGTENLQQLAWLPRELAQQDNRRRFPCHLIAVQCPPGEAWTPFLTERRAAPALAAPPSRALRAVVAAMERVLAEPGVDGARVYLTGLSMGGFGAWELAARQPERFAALLPVCGGGDPGSVHRLIGLPTLVFHGADDLVVPPDASRAMVAAFRELGIRVDYRELEGVGHDAWKTAYRPEAGIAWLFAQDQRQQRRGEFAVPPIVPAVDDAVVQPGVFEVTARSRCFCAAGLLAFAALLLDALEADGGPRPVLAAATDEPREGDVVLSLDPTLDAMFELRVGDTMRLVARDAAALRHGVAALRHALRSKPGLQCPRGRFIRRAPLRGGTVVLGPSPVPYPEPMLLAVLRESWSFGARELRGEGLQGLAWLPDDARDRVRAAAVRHGVALGSSSTVQAAVAGALDVRPVDGALPDVATILSLAVPGAAEPVPFVLRLPTLGPDAVLSALRTRLPAVAERADRQGRAVHVGSFASRLGQLLRDS